MTIALNPPLPFPPLILLKPKSKIPHPSHLHPLLPLHIKTLHIPIPMPMHTDIVVSPVLDDLAAVPVDTDIAVVFAEGDGVVVALFAAVAGYAAVAAEDAAGVDVDGVDSITRVGCARSMIWVGGVRGDGAGAVLACSGGVVAHV